MKQKPKPVCIPTGAIVRCPGCGGMVQQPCLLCYLTTGEMPERAVPTPATRTCMKCQVEKPISDFGVESFASLSYHETYRTCLQCRFKKVRSHDD